jgi:hypothetical protein
MGGGKIEKEVMTSPHQHPKLSSTHTKKRKEEEECLAAGNGTCGSGSAG